MPELKKNVICSILGSKLSTKGCIFYLSLENFTFIQATQSTSTSTEQMTIIKLHTFTHTQIA